MATDSKAAFDALFKEATWGDLVDPRERFFDDPSFDNSYGFIPTGRIEDRDEGQNRPVFETQAELDEIRAASRYLDDRLAFAIGVRENLSSFIVGSGFSYRVLPEKSTGLTDALRQATEVVDEFLDRHDWIGELDLELFQRELRDGEFFLSYWPQDDGRMEVRIVEPERVREPAQPTRWNRFGIETEQDDIGARLGYWVYFDRANDEPTWLPAARVLHHKVNVDRAVKRGLSDYVPLEQDLPQAGKLLRAMVRGAGIQAAVPFIREHAAGTTQAQVASLRSSNAVEEKTATYRTGQRTEYRGSYKPGTVLDVREGLTYKASPLANGEAARAYVEIMQASLRAMGVRWCAPEFIISGDASNANYASTLIAGGPFVRYCERRQTRLARSHSRTLWRVLKHACEDGRIRSSYDELKRLIDLQVTGPEVAIADRVGETARREMLVRGGVMSRKTWADKEGLDYEQEQANGAAVQQPQTFGPQQPTVESVREQRRQLTEALWRGHP